MPNSVKLLSVATAVPDNMLAQEDVAAAAERVFASRYPDFSRIAHVFQTTGIRQRYAVRPVEWYLEPRSWPVRTAVYLDGASELFYRVADRALEAAGLRAAEVDTVVTVSSTGIATPSLEARVSARIGFREDVQRVPVFGLGCAGGISGLSIAARLARSQPGTTVLMVAVEICTLAFRLDELTKANIVATALFGDGAAAVVLRANEDPGELTVGCSGEHTWPDTLDIMGWKVDPQGFGVIFDRAIPPFAEEHIGAAVASILGRAGLAPADIGRFVCHPGGIKVLHALEQALQLDRGVLDHERGVLREYGNMSGPTVLFVLDRALRSGLPPRSLLTALGPGFTASCVALEAAA